VCYHLSLLSGHIKNVYDEDAVCVRCSGGDVVDARSSGAVDAMDSDDGDAAMSDADGEVMVRVCSELVAFDQVTDAMIARMTSSEKADYIRIGQQLYDQFNH